MNRSDIGQGRAPRFPVLALAALMSVTIVLAHAQAASAFIPDFTCRWPHAAGSNLYLYYQWGPDIDDPAPLGLSWRSAFTYAAGDWSNTPTPLFVRPGGTQYTFDTYYATDGTLGHMALMVWDSNGNCLNMYPQGNRATEQSLFKAEDTAGHEIGHGVPLAHSDVSTALMWSAYNAVGVPQQDDINGVNWMYP